MKKSILFLIFILGVTSLSYEKIIDEEYGLTFERDVKITMRAKTRSTQDLNISHTL